MLHYVMATTGVAGAQSLMIGDTTHDIDLAHNAVARTRSRSPTARIRRPDSPRGHLACQCRLDRSAA